MNPVEAIRLPEPEPTKFPVGFDTKRICYWKARGTWHLYLPGGGLGNLTAHDVTEHEDGTITASPSILISSHRPGARMRHGYLRRGRWEPCGDDQPLPRPT